MYVMDPRFQLWLVLKRSQIKAAQYHGSIYDASPAQRGPKKPTGEWNSEEITADSQSTSARSAATAA